MALEIPGTLGENDHPRKGDGIPHADVQSALAAIRGVFESGRYLKAWDAGKALGPLQTWPGLEGLLLAGRLANQLGDGRLGDRLHLRARRLHPESGEAWLSAMRIASSRFGAWAMRPVVERGGPPGTDPAEALALRARLASALRDFDEAERRIGEAAALAPENAWIVLQGGIIRAEADEHAAALEAADQALALRPWYRPAVDFRARELVNLGREDEAIAFLEEAVGRTEAASTCVDLLELQLERGAYAAAEATLARIVERTPLRNRAYEDWLEARRSDVAYFLGDVARAAEHARRSRYPFYGALADRLVTATSTRRCVLPVPFVRQHEKTCAPATLSAICAFHGVEADHLGIAEAICYDGTPDHAERRWAEGRGFTVREFRVTWDAAVALVERGLPFTLTMVDPGNAHLVAVAGFDEARGVLLLRDPSARSLTEITAGWLAERASTGPRGMALAPPGRPGALDGIELPEAGLYDLYHRTQAGLVDHDRPAAQAAAEELARAAPGHRLALQAERSLARYDGSRERELAALEALLAQYPDDVNLRLARQGMLADLGRTRERVAWLRAETARAPHPLLSQALADALMHDARDLAESVTLNRCLVRRMPWDGAAHHVLGDALWRTGARDEALRAYRAGACLDGTNDHFAETYFRSARALGRTDEALRLLRARFERYGGKSHLPAVTLAGALDALEASAEQLDVLERAIARRPDDGTLLLFTARALAIAGQRARAAELLERARASAHAAEVFRTVALLEEMEGNLHAAAGARVRAAEAEPLDAGAAEEAARLLAETQDRAAAVAFLRGRVERFPHHQGLGRALIGWLEGEPPEVREAELRRYLAASPSDAWALRELALHLSANGRNPEAFEALDRAAAIDPSSASLHNVRATLLRRAGRIEEARAELRASLRVEVDQDWAIEELVELAPDGAGRAAELGFVEAEMARQVTFGDAMLAYQARGAGVLPAESLLATLREAHAARPDLWHAWVALARQLVGMERLDEARGILEEARSRFPLLPRISLELADVHRAMGDAAAARRMLEQTLELNPAWRTPVLRLAELLEGAGEWQAAHDVLARALRHEPSSGLLHGWLAEALIGLGREDEAIPELERALRLDPGYGWALATLRQLCAAPARRAIPLELAEGLVRERPRDPRAWLVAARVRPALDDRMAAVERALAIDPARADAVRVRMDLLAEAGRIDEAIAAVDAAPCRGPPPRELRLQTARLAHQAGRKDEARVALEALLSSEPDFLEAWEQAAEWHDAAGRHAECLEAARQVVRLSPHRGASHGWLGFALLAVGERAGGKEALRKAVRLEPTHVWSLRRLFELEVEDRDFAAAEALLPHFEHHLDAGELQRRRLDLAIARRDRAGARSALGPLVAGGDRASLEAGIDALGAAGWLDDAGAALAGALEGESLPEAAGFGWYRWAEKALTRRGRRRRLEAAMWRAERPGPALSAAARAWLEKMAEAGERRLVRRFVRCFGARLEADVQLWGTAGYALATLGDHAGTVRCLGRWRAREGLEPWMLLNLSLAHCSLGDLAAAAEVSEAALRLADDATRVRHVAVVSAHDAIRGVPAGEARPPPAPTEELGGLFAWLAAVGRAVRTAEGPGDPHAAWREVVPELRRAAALCPLLGEPPGLRRLWWRVLARLARALGRRGPAVAGWFLRGALRALVAR